MDTSVKIVEVGDLLLLENPTHRPISSSAAGKIDGINTAIPVTQYDSSAIDKIDSPPHVKTLKLNIQANGFNHNSLMYEPMKRSINPELIVRRGEAFCLTLVLSRSFARETDSFSFSFTVKDCPHPKSSNGTQENVPLVFNATLPSADKRWHAVCNHISRDGRTLFVQVIPSINCIVNKWSICIYTKYIQKLYKYPYPGCFYILFNAMNADDDAYVSEEFKRNEYIMNEFGAFFIGTARKHDLHKWHFGQYEKDMLESAFYLIHQICKLPYHECYNLLSIVRALSQHGIEEKVIECSWPNDYRGGTTQMQWEGSKLILHNLLKKKKPVKYGHCYTYSCVLVSVMRVLGVAARPVSGFNIAHTVIDKNNTLVNKYIKPNGTIIEGKSNELFCYYTWPEVFMKRRDIGSDYDGWQWFGTNEGPTSLVALQREEYFKPYNTLCTFYAVNPDSRVWIYFQESGSYKLSGHIQDLSASKVVTKQIGNWKSQDITKEYKSNKGNISDSYLMPLLKSQKLVCNYIKNEEENKDIAIDVNTPDDVIIGNPIRIQCNLTNNDESNSYKVIISQTLYSVLYTGKIHQSLAEDMKELVLVPEEGHTQVMECLVHEYFRKISHQNLFKYTLSVHIREIDFHTYLEVPFKMSYPDISVKVLGRPSTTQHHLVSVEALSPPMILKHTRIILEDIAVETNKVSTKKIIVGRSEQLKVRFLVKALKPGKHLLKATYATECGRSVAYLEYYVCDNYE